MFSTSSKEIIINPLHCRVPLLYLPMNKWINVSIDVLSFVSECFKTQTFRSIDFISLSGSCKVRKVFTMRNSLPDGNSNNFIFNGRNDDYVYDINDLIPKSMNFSNEVVYENINVNHEKAQSINNNLIMMMNNNGNVKMNNPIVNLNSKNGALNIKQQQQIGNFIVYLVNNLQILKPISLTQPVISNQNKDNVINENARQVSSFSQNFQSHLNNPDFNSNREVIQRSKSNKREFKIDKSKLPSIHTKNMNKVGKEIKTIDKSPQMEIRKLKLPPIGIKKNNKSNDKKEVNCKIFKESEKIQLEADSVLKMDNNDYLGKWENRENEEFEEFEKKIGIDQKQLKNRVEEKKKTILISEY